MSNHHYIASIAFTASAMLASAAAFAHPKLLSSMPTDKAEGAAPAMIELKFSESLFTQFSGANLVMTEMPGMSEHDAMKIAAKVTADDDPKAMVITPVQPLIQSRMAGCFVGYAPDVRELLLQGEVTS